MYLPVHDSTALTEVFERSEEEPQLVFVFDPHCGLNTRALKQLDEVEGFDIHVVDVARNHGLGVAIQLATGVKHESPQVLLLSGRTAVWHASHRGITRDAVREALTVR